MKGPQAVLFDLDGTLVDSEPVIAAALTAACAKAGLYGDPPLERFLALTGLPLETILVAVGLPIELAARFRAEATARIDQTQLFPGALTMLSGLHAREVKIGVITGKEEVRTLATLDHLEIRGVVDEVVTPDHPPDPKPSPQGVWWLCERLGVAPEQAVMVGDTVADLRAGAAAGVRTVACLWGAGRAEALAQYAPWRMVDDFDALSALLDGLTATGDKDGRQGRASPLGFGRVSAHHRPGDH